jgi:hypothetical protein
LLIEGDGGWSFLVLAASVGAAAESGKAWFD